MCQNVSGLSDAAASGSLELLRDPRIGPPSVRRHRGGDGLPSGVAVVRLTRSRGERNALHFDAGRLTKETSDEETARVDHGVREAESEATPICPSRLHDLAYGCGGDSSLGGRAYHAPERFMRDLPCGRDRVMTIGWRLGIPLPPSSSKTETYGARERHGSTDTDGYRVR